MRVFLLLLSVCVAVTIAYEIPGIPSIAVTGIDHSNPKDVRLTLLGGAQIELKVVGSIDFHSSTAHYDVDFSLTRCPLLGNINGKGVITIVSQSPFKMTGTLTAQGKSVVIGLSASSPTGHIISYNPHAAMEKHSRSRYLPGYERKALSATFADVTESYALQKTLYGREALRTRYCDDKTVQHAVSVGVILDDGMIKALERDLRTKIEDRRSPTGLTEEGELWVESLIAQASRPFEESFNTRVELALVSTLAVAEKSKVSSYSSASWNEAPATRHNCVYDIDTKLTQFSAWTSQWDQQLEDLSAVVLLTDCYPPPGTIGLSNTGWLCDQGSSYCNRNTRWGFSDCHRGACPEDTAACFAKTAVVSYVSGQASVVFSHELGHLCGCLHSSDRGDLMSTYLSANVNVHFNTDNTDHACALFSAVDANSQNCVRRT